ncbi:uncharacterized protein LTR77_007510 [Saxophila tyrrhenica]|uniref:Uncharacterized protein n=1 Tax=Saxophila tyrrhenica TaxID=1690608 RepID=A0AAV9P6X0_9PEZI|nr:hypothetical protein LTR77_007510 [Saxophila tyrrhenica]
MLAIEAAMRSLLVAAALSRPTTAQTNPPMRRAYSTDTNVTLSFNSGGPNHCPRNGSSDTITFSTFFPLDLYGDQQACFNLADVFGSNKSVQSNFGGFEASGLKYTNLTYGYSIYGAENYDPGTNYSTVLYHQYGIDAGDSDEWDQSEYAPRYVQFYPGRDCDQAGDAQGNLVPWFQSSCRAKHDCEQAPASIKSFIIGTVTDDYPYPKHCNLMSVYDAATTTRPVLAAVVGCVAVVAWFVGL